MRPERETMEGGTECVRDPDDLPTTSAAAAAAAASSISISPSHGR